MPKHKYWDPVAETTVEVDYGPVKEVHAEPNRLHKIEFAWAEFNIPLDWWYFMFKVYTKYESSHALIMALFFDKEIVDLKNIPMIATKMNNKIYNECTRMLESCEIKSLKDHKTMRETIHQHVTEYDVSIIEPKDKPAPYVDLRPYVFLRFLLFIPVVPEEVLHAMYVQEAAKESQKIILAEAEKIKSLQTEHYQKYGTLIEKSKVYISNFFK